MINPKPLPQNMPMEDKTVVLNGVSKLLLFSVDACKSMTKEQAIATFENAADLFLQKAEAMKKRAD